MNLFLANTTASPILPPRERAMGVGSTGCERETVALPVLGKESPSPRGGVYLSPGRHDFIALLTKEDASVTEAFRLMLGCKAGLSKQWMKRHMVAIGG